MAYETKAKADKLNPHKKIHGKAGSSAEARAAAPAAHRVAPPDLEAPLMPEDASDAESEPDGDLEKRKSGAFAGALTIDDAAAFDPEPAERAALASSSRGHTLPLYVPPSGAHPPDAPGPPLPPGSPAKRDFHSPRDPESDMASPLGSSPMDSQYWRLRPKIPLLRLDMLAPIPAAEASIATDWGADAICGRDGCRDGDHEPYSVENSSGGSFVSASVADLDPAGLAQLPPAEEQGLGFLWKEVAAICLLFA